MKKLILAAALIAGTTAAASAADMRMPTKAPMMAPAPIYSWTGFYAGVNAGYQWGDTDVTYSQGGAYLPVTADVTFANALGSPSIGRDGFTGGVQAGYNWQSGALVYGIEADVSSVSNDDGLLASGTLPLAGTVNTSIVTVSQDWLFTLRARLGYAAGPALFYVTGGLAVGDVDFAQLFFHAATGTFESGSVSETQAGWTVGAGVEYMFAPKWTAKLEYLYVDLGNVGFNSANNGFPTFTASHSADFTQHIGRLGINYKF